MRENGGRGNKEAYLCRGEGAQSPNFPPVNFQLEWKTDARPVQRKDHATMDIRGIGGVWNRGNHGPGYEGVNSRQEETADPGRTARAGPIPASRASSIEIEMQANSVCVCVCVCVCERERERESAGWGGERERERKRERRGHVGLRKYQVLTPSS
jgi:hypothetical protein